MTVEIRPLTPELAEDYFDFFDNRAFTDHAEWSCCYCTFFHLNRALEKELENAVQADGGGVDALRRALKGAAQQFIEQGNLRGDLA